MATTLLSNVPSGTDNTALTSANKATVCANPNPWDSVVFGSGGSASIQTVSGAKVIRYATTSGNSTTGWRTASLGAQINDFTVKHRFKAPATTPTAPFTIDKGFSDGAEATGAWAIVLINSGGAIGCRLDHASGTAGTLAGTAPTLSPGGEYTVRGRIVGGTSGELRLYNAAGTEVAAWSGANTSFGATGSYRTGIGNGSAGIAQFDSLEVKVGTGPGLIDAASVITVNAGTDASAYTTDTVNLSATRGSGTGSGTVSWSWAATTKPAGSTVTFGSPTDPSGATTAQVSVAGTYIFTVTGVDDSGSDTDAVQFVFSDAPASVVPVSVVSATGWTATPSGTVVANLGDHDATTRIVSPDNPTGALVKTLKMGSLAKPGTGVGLTGRFEDSYVQAASTSTVVAKLYGANGTTLYSTQTAPTFPTVAGARDVTFPAADIASIPAGDFTSGLCVDFVVTAAP